jgi:uncharacterized protein
MSFSSAFGWTERNSNWLQTALKRKEINMSAKNKEIVERVNASFAEGGVEGFLSHCADDVAWAIVGNKTTRGKNAIREWMASMDMEPPKFTVDNIIAEGDFVTSYGDMTMKEKDGKTVPYAYCDIYRFRNEKIVELNSFVIKTVAKAESASGE